MAVTYPATATAQKARFTALLYVVEKFLITQVTLFLFTKLTKFLLWCRISSDFFEDNGLIGLNTCKFSAIGHTFVTIVLHQLRHKLAAIPCLIIIIIMGVRIRTPIIITIKLLIPLIT